MLWILLPAYNEEASLPRLLPKIAAAMEDKELPYRIVVVDDGSRDGTAGVLEESARSFPLDVIRHPLNRGLGETERDGFEHVAGRAGPDDVIVRLDCDDTHEPSYIFRLVDKLDEGYDVVNASRFGEGGGQRGVSRYRATISLAANLFMKIVFPIRGPRDYSCGYRAYRARVIQDALRVYGNDFIQLSGLGFTSTLEMIVKLHLLGCRFAEVPFVLRYDQKVSRSKMVTSVTTLGYIIMAVLYYWPFGGWLRAYRGVRKLYRKDRDEAMEKFGVYEYRQRTAGSSTPGD